MIAARTGAHVAVVEESTRLRVLVIEDDADTAQSMTMLVHLLGHEARAAPDGPAALRAARERPPDVVILDIRLPSLDGFEVAKRLQEQATEKKPFLIAVTGCGRESDRRHAEEVGIDLYLLKPVDPQALQRLLRRFKALLGK